MSNYLQKQTEAFRGNVISASSKISNKRTLGADLPTTSVPSPSPSNASTNSKTDGTKAKRPKIEPQIPQNVVYSQPQDSGVGSDMMTQVQYIIKYLKEKNEAKTFQDIVGYLGLPALHLSPEKKVSLAGILRQHPRIQWHPDPSNNSHEWDAGLFSHRPIINVRSTEDLKAFLQKTNSFQGLSVKDLKDGWESAESGVTALESERNVLVTRTKKDNHARMVWPDDPSLYHDVDPEFKMEWRTLELPSEDDVVTKLIQQGQKPASDDPSKRIKAPAKPKEKKKRVNRSGGKTTNTHMQHLLKDFSNRRA